MSNINIHFDTNLKINFNNKDIPQYIPNIFKILNLNPSMQINILFVDNNSKIIFSLFQYSFFEIDCLIFSFLVSLIVFNFIYLYLIFLHLNFYLF